MNNVVIIGAGVIGMFAALRLAQRGAHVIVLEGEREDLTSYSPTASLAAAGMLAPVSDLTGAQHNDLQALALESFDLWRNQSKGALWEDGLRFDGGIVLAKDESEAQAFQSKADALQRRVQKLSAKDWRKRTGFQTSAAHAFFVLDEGVADPIRVLSGLVMDARRHGVQVIYGADVKTVEANRVETYDQGAFDADMVLLAPGPWASEQMVALAPALKHVTPAAGHIVPVKLTHPIDANIHGENFYLAPRAEDAVLGATMEFGRYERSVLPERVEELRAAAERALPGEVQIRSDARPWVGVRPMSPDGAPIIGKSGPVLVACGHSRNGWLLAPVTAEIVCAHVFGTSLSPLWAAFSPDRFEGAK